MHNPQPRIEYNAFGEVIGNSILIDYSEGLPLQHNVFNTAPRGETIISDDPIDLPDSVYLTLSPKGAILESRLLTALAQTSQAPLSKRPKLTN